MKKLFYLFLLLIFLYRYFNLNTEDFYYLNKYTFNRIYILENGINEQFSITENNLYSCKNLRPYQNCLFEEKFCITYASVICLK